MVALLTNLDLMDHGRVYAWANIWYNLYNVQGAALITVLTDSVSSNPTRLGFSTDIFVPAY